MSQEHPGFSILSCINSIDKLQFQRLRAVLDDKVAYGPFAGTVVIDEFTWGDACSKLLGLYEHYLHPSIQEVAKKKIDGVINVGCAEGYYAVGLARLLPFSLVHAHDSSELAQSVCKKMAERNGVLDRISIGGQVDRRGFAQMLELYRNPFVLMDIEGAENELLRPDEIPALNRAEMICECHESGLPLGIEELAGRFSYSHVVRYIDETDLPATSVREIANLPGQIRMSLLCEKRSHRMRWLHMSPRTIL